MYAMLGRKRSDTKDVLSSTMCIAEHNLNARPLNLYSSDVNDLEVLIPNHLLLGNKYMCLPNLNAQNGLSVIGCCFNKIKPSELLNEKDFADFAWKLQILTKMATYSK